MSHEQQASRTPPKKTGPSGTEEAHTPVRGDARLAAAPIPGVVRWRSNGPYVCRGQRSPKGGSQHRATSVTWGVPTARALAGPALADATPVRPSLRRPSGPLPQSRTCCARRRTFRASL